MQRHPYFFKPIYSLLAGLLISAASIAATAPSSAPQVELKTSAGTIVLELYPEAAPKTVKNFLQYVNEGFYNGTIFHRVIDNFMIQGGGLDKNLNPKKTKGSIPLEAQMALDHGLKNDVGTIAMARQERPDTASSQFFINVANNDFLNAQPIPDGDPVQIMRGGIIRTMPRAQALLISAGYTPFGRVIDGMNVVNQVKIAPTEARGENSNLPKETITILSAKLLNKNITPKTMEEQTAPKLPSQGNQGESTPTSQSTSN